MGHTRATVRSYVHAQQFPERAARESGLGILAPYREHLEARLAAGNENAAAGTPRPRLFQIDQAGAPLAEPAAHHPGQGHAAHVAPQSHRIRVSLVCWSVPWPDVVPATGMAAGASAAEP
ncbi:hypothetical protein D9623_20490 [Azospirillum brasilense]|uniref:Uncharacterized protein n=1 Tax=Azospirillum brasilense TaxID=192 RepID=A0A4D8QR77_AZOBR|nr:hypothetical protein D3868_18330 [Azospirillum brasilense]QEL92443.1 hypothetical protein D9621_20245 [Azospirillum brasilense]QEL98747.1 hypothetical protein D9623_20490 [Azospirillum brasilense]